MPGNHLAPCFPCACNEISPVAGLIHNKNGGVVETEAGADEFDRLGHQHLWFWEFS